MAAEATAEKKFHCPNCGAEAHWNPAKHALVCGYCGTVAPTETETVNGEVRENDLMAALQRVDDNHRGWEAERTSVKCQSCQAISVFDPNRVGQRCDFCGSTQLVSYEQIKAPIRPESLLPFKWSETQVREAIRQWYGSRWFAPNSLKTAALTDTVKGVYLPYWTFDAQAHADWQAESGTYYYETERFRDSEGREQTRQVRHTRWRPSSGSLDHFFDDELVCGSKGVNHDLLLKIEPFPTREVIPYHGSYLAGWLVEQYQIDLAAAHTHSQAEMKQELQRLCAAQVPGDTHRHLQVEAHFTDITFKHTLLPVWLLSFRYGTKNYQVLINGVNGAIAGQHPLSWVKITFLVLFVLIAVLIFAATRH